MRSVIGAERAAIVDEDYNEAELEMENIETGDVNSNEETAESSIK